MFRISRSRYTMPLCAEGGHIPAKLLNNTFVDTLVHLERNFRGLSQWPKSCFNHNCALRQRMLVISPEWRASQVRDCNRSSYTKGIHRRDESDWNGDVCEWIQIELQRHPEMSSLESLTMHSPSQHLLQNSMCFRPPTLFQLA